jgi:hypothetical protein
MFVLSYNAMIWLDQVLAAPTIGLQLEPGLVTGADHFRILRPLMERWIGTGGSIAFTESNQFQLGFLHNDFRVTLDHENTIITFQYKPSIAPSPGNLGELRYNRQLQPYSTLIDEQLALLREIVAPILRERSRKLRRIGIVAATKLAHDKLPPGITTYIESLGRPWQRAVDMATGTTLVKIGSGDGYVDRCHHFLEFNHVDRPGFVEVRLDWQRVFNPYLELSNDQLEKKFKEWTAAAIEYFSRFGAGDLHYE